VSIYKLFTTTDGDGAASLDVIANGTITGVLFSGYAILAVDNDSFEAEVSFSSTSGFATNDTKSSIAKVASQSAVSTAESAQMGINVMISPLEIPVTQGERLYLHTATPSGTPTIRMSAYLYVKDRVGSPRRTRQ